MDQSGRGQFRPIASPVALTTGVCVGCVTGLSAFTSAARCGRRLPFASLQSSGWHMTFWERYGTDPSDLGIRGYVVVISVHRTGRRRRITADERLLARSDAVPVCDAGNSEACGGSQAGLCDFCRTLFATGLTILSPATDIASLAGMIHVVCQMRRLGRGFSMCDPPEKGTLHLSIS
jgi:hypothetical protein